METELDIEKTDALLAYLRWAGHIDQTEEPHFQNLAGGVSNRTVLVQRPSGEAWVLKQALAKLRVPVDWFSSPERIHREALGLRWLGQLAPPDTIPPLVWEDHEFHLLAMQAVPQPHQNWKTMLLAGRLELSHVDQFGLLLATIHRHAYECRTEMAPVFTDRSFFESLRLEPYYLYTAQQVRPATGFLHELWADTRAHVNTLVHGDYSPKNILVYQDRLILLDHEVIHWGDPAFDLGFSLTHLLSKAHHIERLRPAFAEAARRYWQVYRRALGNPEWTSFLETRAVRHTLGCLLARVEGRSPLEYLTAGERRRQREVSLALMFDPPATVPDLVERFVERL